MAKQLTLLDGVVDGFSPLLELLAPFSISQRLPNVGLPRAARAPCSSKRRRLKSGNEKDERLRRMLLLLAAFPVHCTGRRRRRCETLFSVGFLLAMQSRNSTRLLMSLCLHCHGY